MAHVESVMAQDESVTPRVESVTAHVDSAMAHIDSAIPRIESLTPRIELVTSYGESVNHHAGFLTRDGRSAKCELGSWTRHAGLRVAKVCPILAQPILQIRYIDRMTHREPHAHESVPPLRSSGGAGARLADPAEFQRLFDTHFDELARHAYRYVQSIDEAKDLVHDAFVRLWSRRDEVDFETSVRAYLFATVRNLAVDHLRRRRREERWRERSRHIAGSAGGVAPTDPARDLLNLEIEAAIRDAVATLPPRQREVLLLRWERQASYDDVARELGISPKTVSIHIGRALASLRAALGHLLDRTP